MVAMIFWEKPGCAGNARQKALLRASGHQLEVRDLLAEAWSPKALRGFFDGLPVTSWFNVRAPRIHRGDVRPELLTEQEALALLIDDPLLIRRPLIQIGDVRLCGFETARIAAAAGVAMADSNVDGSCARSSVEAGCA